MKEPDYSLHFIKKKCKLYRILYNVVMWILIIDSFVFISFGLSATELLMLVNNNHLVFWAIMISLAVSMLLLCVLMDFIFTKLKSYISIKLGFDIIASSENDQKEDTD